MLFILENQLWFMLLLSSEAITKYTHALNKGFPHSAAATVFHCLPRPLNARMWGYFFHFSSEVFNNLWTLDSHASPRLAATSTELSPQLFLWRSFRSDHQHQRPRVHTHYALQHVHVFDRWRSTTRVGAGWQSWRFYWQTGLQNWSVWTCLQHKFVN